MNRDQFRAHCAADDNGCWIWLGYVNEDGYGQTPAAVEGAGRLAHRVSHVLFVGPIPAGYDVDHLCRVRACVNPAHLEAVVHLDNMRRAVPFRSVPTHCLRNHPFTPENTYQIPPRKGGGRRQCRTCQREAVRRYKESRRKAS